MMERLLKNDLYLKIFSVALALLLWSVVIRDYNAPESRTLTIPIQFIPHPVYAVLDGPPQGSSVDIQVNDRKLVVDTLRADQFRAIVDYSQVKEPGRPTTLDVKVEGPANVDFYIISPKQVTVTLIEQGTKLVQATAVPNTGVITVDGREFRYRTHALVDQISITGRKDFLQFVRQARLEVAREQLTPPRRDGLIDLSPQRVQARVVPLDDAGQQVANLPTTTAEVEVTWEELAPGKAYNLKPVLAGSPAVGYEVSSVTVEPQQVTVRPVQVGGALPNLPALDLSLVDVTGQAKTFTTTARVILPPGTVVTPEQVNVTVTIGEVKVERVFGQMSVQVVGPADLQGAILTPSTVEVRLRGPSSVVGRVGPDTVTVSVNVEGLGPGTHTVPVHLSGLPNGVDLTINPAVVQVTIPNR
jgi:YbbR domain-containing protein